MKQIPDTFVEISDCYPPQPGIYMIVFDSEIVYIGESQDVNSRLDSYLIVRDDQTKVYFKHVSDTDKRKEVEAEFIKELEPKYNRYPNYGHGPESIRIDSSGLGNKTIKFQSYLFQLLKDEEEIILPKLTEKIIQKNENGEVVGTVEGVPISVNTDTDDPYQSVKQRVSTNMVTLEEKYDNINHEFVSGRPGFMKTKKYIYNSPDYKDGING